MLERKDLFRGALVKITSYSAFKVCVVIGDSTVPGKVRVRVYSAAGREFSLARTAKLTTLEALDSTDAKGRHGSTIRSAITEATEIGQRAQPIYAKPKYPTDEPFVVTPEAKKNLQMLNQKLSGFFFGGKKP